MEHFRPLPELFREARLVFQQEVSGQRQPSDNPLEDGSGSPGPRVEAGGDATASRVGPDTQRPQSELASKQTEVDKRFDALTKNFSIENFFKFLGSLLRLNGDKIGKQIQRSPGSRQEIQARINAARANGGNAQSLFPNLRRFAPNTPFNPNDPRTGIGAGLPRRSDVTARAFGSPSDDELRTAREMAAQGPQPGDVVRNDEALGSSEARQTERLPMEQLRGSRLSFDQLHGTSMLTPAGAMSVQEFVNAVTQPPADGQRETVGEMRERRSLLENAYREITEHHLRAYGKASYYAKSLAYHQARGVPAYMVNKPWIVDYVPQLSQERALLNGARQQVLHRIQTFEVMAREGSGPEFDAGFIESLVDQASRNRSVEEARAFLKERGVELRIIDGKATGVLVDPVKLEKARRYDRLNNAGQNVAFDKMKDKPESLDQMTRRLQQEQARKNPTS